MDLSGAVLLDADAGAIPAKYNHIAEIIQDYNPNLELRWIPNRDRTVFDKEPFAIFDTRGNYCIGTFSEDQMDHRIIAHLFNIDNKNGNVLKRLEAEEAAHKALRLKQIMEEREQAHDFAKTIIKSKKHRFRHNGRVYE